MDFNEISESDCCGNGCSNCILDVSTSSTKIAVKRFENKINCLHKYRAYKLSTIKYLVGSDILKLRFQLEYQKDTKNEELTNLILYVPPGHHVMMKTELCCRPYSPYWTDIENFQFEILVNLRPNGIMSQYIKQLKLGDLILFKGPIGKFYHEINQYEHLLIFSQGVAVAPILPIIEQILNNDEDMTREKFSEYKQFWNFNGKIYLAKEICSEANCFKASKNCDIHISDNRHFCEHLAKKIKYGEKIYNFRLNDEEISKNLKLLNLNRIKIIICGSKTFENLIQKCLENYKINKENIILL